MPNVYRKCGCACPSSVSLQALEQEELSVCVNKKSVLAWSKERTLALILFRNRFYLQLFPHCPKMNKKSMWEISSFLSSGHGILHLAAARRMRLRSLNANLFFKEPQQLT